MEMCKKLKWPAESNGLKGRVRPCGGLLVVRCNTQRALDSSLLSFLVYCYQEKYPKFELTHATSDPDAHIVPRRFSPPPKILSGSGSHIRESQPAVQMQTLNCYADVRLFQEL